MRSKVLKKYGNLNLKKKHRGIVMENSENNSILYCLTSLIGIKQKNRSMNNRLAIASSANYKKGIKYRSEVSEYILSTLIFVFCLTLFEHIYVHIFYYTDSLQRNIKLWNVLWTFVFKKIFILNPRIQV